MAYSLRVAWVCLLGVVVLALAFIGAHLASVVLVDRLHMGSLAAWVAPQVCLIGVVVACWALIQWYRRASVRWLGLTCPSCAAALFRDTKRMLGVLQSGRCCGCGAQVIEDEPGPQGAPAGGENTPVPGGTLFAERAAPGGREIG
jgi:hypothetical protein